MFSVSHLFLFDLRGSKKRESNQEKQTRERKGNESWGVDSPPGSPALGHQGELQLPLPQPSSPGQVPARKPHPLGPSARMESPSTYPCTPAPLLQEMLAGSFRNTQDFQHLPI